MAFGCLAAVPLVPFARFQEGGPAVDLRAAPWPRPACSLSTLVLPLPMTAAELQERVFALVRQQVWHLRQPALSLRTHLTNYLGLDRLGRVQLGIRLEYGLGIAVPDPELGEWRTLAEVLACVRRHLPAGAARLEPPAATQP